MNNNNEIESRIRELEDQRYTAVLDGDFQAFSKLMHPSLSYAHSTGSVDTLASYLEKCEAGFYVYHRIEHPIDSITVVGDIVLVRGEMNGEITAGGAIKHLRNKALAVWINGAEGWKLLAYQPTPIV